jgi:hypothetical protein
MNVRKKRQWLVVLAMAVMLLLGGWLSRPQIDPRFVGRWRVRSGHSAFLKLNADGTGTDSSPLTGFVRGERRAPVYWSVSGKTLIVRKEPPSMLSTIQRIISDLLHHSNGLESRVFEISNMSHDEIELEANPGEPPWTLRRRDSGGGGTIQ